MDQLLDPSFTSRNPTDYFLVACKSQPHYTLNLIHSHKPHTHFIHFHCAYMCENKHIDSYQSSLIDVKHEEVEVRQLLGTYATLWASSNYLEYTSLSSQLIVLFLFFKMKRSPTILCSCEPATSQSCIISNLIFKFLFSLCPCYHKDFFTHHPNDGGSKHL